MKKLISYFFIIILSLMVFVLGFSNQKSTTPNSYYQVYLDGSILGTISSKRELQDYIRNQASVIRENVLDYEKKLNAIKDVNDTISKTSETLIGEDYNAFLSFNNTDKVNYLIKNKDKCKISDLKLNSLKLYLDQNLGILNDEDIKKMQEYYDVNKIYLSSNEIYTPNGIEIKKVLTYKDETISIPNMYKKIISLKNCTIPGYVFTIKNSDDKEKVVYVTDKDIFETSIDTMAGIFIGEDNYKKYKEDNQATIESTGEIIKNVYVQEEITYKAVNVPTDEVIYTDSTELSKYLLYGQNYEENKVTVEAGDTISSISYDNEISVEEFLISNPEYTSENNLLYQGKQVVIAKVSPQINIVEEVYSVEDIESSYKTVEEYDENMAQGDKVVTQQGETGIDRVSQNVKSVNGQITYVEPVNKEVIKAAVDKKITVGTKFIPNVGSTTSWGWPTNSGYTLSSRYGYRIAVFGEGNFHTGIDIAGTGYGSPVYAANNGVIEKITYASTYGYHIIINHNNGYHSVYAHMSGFAKGLSLGSTVSRGQTIGYVGSSGWATGPHLHFEIRNCPKYACVTNPLSYY